MNAPDQRNRPALADEILTILRCIACQSELRHEPDGFVCVGCDRKYPEVKGVVRFVDAQHYAGSFGFQWQVFHQTQLDNESSRRSENDFRRRTGFEPADLAGKLLLDVGCGMGRFAEVATRWGARVVGVDLSVAAEVAQKNLKDRVKDGQAVFFQADVFHLPFAPESFDYIYSLGVLHHTPDCKAAFETLPRLLKPGGRIAIWIYSRYNNWYRMSDAYRKVTRRMPPRLLSNLCYAVLPLYGVHRVLRKVPLVGRAASGALAYLIPMSLNPDPKWRLLDTFDWYSPWYQSKHTYEEVFRWFEECGLENLRVIEQPISVQGQKPLTARREEDPCHPGADAASRQASKVLA